MNLREDSIVMGERGDDFPEVAKLAKIALAIKSHHAHQRDSSRFSVASERTS